MKMKQRGGTRLLVPIIIALIAGLVGLDNLFGALARARANPPGSQEGMQMAVDVASDVRNGKPLGKRDFSDTPSGRVSRAMYELLVSTTAADARLALGLERIDWDWVMTSESFDGKENLDKSLEKIRAAQKLHKSYRRTIDHDIETCIRAIEHEAKSDAYARRELVDFRASLKRNTSLFYARMINEWMTEYLDKTESMYQFLRSRRDRYEINGSGAIVFDQAVSLLENREFDSMIGDLIECEDAIARLEKSREKMASAALEQARRRLKNPSY